MAYETKLIETYPGFGPSVVVDGDMEDSPLTNWTAIGINPFLEGTPPDVHGGCVSIDATCNAPPGQIRQTINVEGGHRYKIKAWGMVKNAGHRWRMRLYSTVPSSIWTGPWHNALSWESETKFYRIPAGYTQIQVWLEIEAFGDQVWFDDVTVEREAPVPMEEIDLMFRATDDWSLLQQGIRINDPIIKEIWGGELEDQLVRRLEGKRVIPMELNLESANANTLIDDVNGLEKMLRHAARYRKDGWGGEVFLQFKTDGATHPVWYPVLCGQIDKTALMKKCCSDQRIDKVPVVIICEAYWESVFSYDLHNLVDNPGFEEWNAGICDIEPDCWDDWSNCGAGEGRNDQETDIVEEGCEALRIEAINIIVMGNRQGVEQDISARVQPNHVYRFLFSVQNTAITNGTLRVYVEGSWSGPYLPWPLNSAAAHANYTQYTGTFVPHVNDAQVWVRAEILGAGNCSGIVHLDKVMVMEQTDIPIGWMSSSYLTNHYDRDANELNFISVCDIPGEVDAEVRIDQEVSAALSDFHIARRSRRTCGDPCYFVWQFTPCEAYTTAEGGVGGACVPGLTDAACIDTDKIIDASSPDGSRITCDFTGNQTMVLRAYWLIEDHLANYSGKYQVAILCKKTGTTDTIHMKIRAYQDTANVSQAYWREMDVPTATDWELLMGWRVITFPIGTHDSDQWGEGNRWVIQVYADNSGGGAHTDDLWIAGLYLIPIDEEYLIGGAPSITWAANDRISVMDLDGDKGVFPYRASDDTYFANAGAVGKYPKLKPEIENRLYFILANAREVDIEDTSFVSLVYRPRGIFLRGINP